MFPVTFSSLTITKTPLSDSVRLRLPFGAAVDTVGIITTVAGMPPTPMVIRPGVGDAGPTR